MIRLRGSGRAALAAASGLLAAVLGGAAPLANATADPVLVFAAASLKTALDEMVPALERAAGVRLRTSYAASSALARQIEAGAPADLFVSADQDWMDYLEARGLLRPRTRVPLVGNRLVLVAPRDRPVSLAIARGFPLARALGTDRLAIADPAMVPAGKYARAALTSLGVWESVATRLAPADNVRVALAFVARGEAPLGIVYRSDAIAEPAVTVVGVFPESTHPPIVYPAALTVRAGAAAARVLDHLRSPSAGTIWTKHGMTTPSG